MRKQTKLVAVLSTAALLAIGASMTSFAAQGWAEEDGTWVYYDRNGERVTDKWAKSGNNWYYLDSDGEMAIDTLIDDGDNYYYVDINGVMASNQWVAIENEDAGEDNEPENYWYYFQANGKALTNGNNSTVSLKTINGKKYAFDSDGKMLYGWVNKENAERIDNTDGTAFKEGDYYFGDENDGAMTVGWLQTDITYDEATGEDYKLVAPVFNDDEDQTRWFYFQSNGKKVKSDNPDLQKNKTINGKKYSFDNNGAMVAEWNMDQAKKNATASTPGEAAWSTAWRYYNSVDDGARLSKGWFKVVAAEMLNETKYNDDEDAWYYADGNGHLYAGEFKTINGKKYAFRQDGRMIDGLQLINVKGGFLVEGDDGKYNFETEDDFNENTATALENGYRYYYFGDGDDGAMKTGNTKVTIDGDTFNFYFETAGALKGAGKTGEKDKKFYLGGKLVAAGKDEKYQVVKVIEDQTDANDVSYTVYEKYDDVQDLVDNSIVEKIPTEDYKDLSANDMKNKYGVNKKGADVSELYMPIDGVDMSDYVLVNTSGKKITSNGKNKDGNDYYYVIDKKEIKSIYVEN